MHLSLNKPRHILPLIYESYDYWFFSSIYGLLPVGQIHRQTLGHFKCVFQCCHDTNVTLSWYLWKLYMEKENRLNCMALWGTPVMWNSMCNSLKNKQMGLIRVSRLFSKLLDIRSVYWFLFRNCNTENCAKTTSNNVWKWPWTIINTVRIVNIVPYFS